MRRSYGTGGVGAAGRQPPTLTSTTDGNEDTMTLPVRTPIRFSATVLVALCLGTAIRAEEKHYHPQLGISSDGHLFLISTIVSPKMKADIVFSYFEEEGEF